MIKIVVMVDSTGTTTTATSLWKVCFVEFHPSIQQGPRQNRRTRASILKRRQFNELRGTRWKDATPPGSLAVEKLYVADALAAALFNSSQQVFTWSIVCRGLPIATRIVKRSRRRVCERKIRPLRLTASSIA